MLTKLVVYPLLETACRPDEPKELDIRFQCNAITAERWLKHPAVVAISHTARRTLFSAD